MFYLKNARFNKYTGNSSNAILVRVLFVVCPSRNFCVFNYIYMLRGWTSGYIVVHASFRRSPIDLRASRFNTTLYRRIFDILTNAADIPQSSNGSLSEQLIYEYTSQSLGLEKRKVEKQQSLNRRSYRNKKILKIVNNLCCCAKNFGNDTEFFLIIILLPYASICFIIPIERDG